LKVLQIREMILRADRIVVVCQWLHDALLANGAPPKKLVLSRQGVSPTFLEATKSARPPKARLADETLRLLYVGRWDRAKGIDVAVRAVRRLPLHVDVQMVILAAPGAADGGAYEREVRTLALADPRISVAGPVSRDELPNVLADYDALVVPSLVLETGPLVVLEAQAAGLLVLGSRLGGIAELLESDPASELVDAGNVEAWTTSILNLWHHRRERVFKRPPVSMRTMEHVATEMGSLYREL
jgi:glycosyltransferase involved in cell wall biosynthesis